MQSLHQLKSTSLLVASTVDPASFNLAQSLLAKTGVWKEINKGNIWMSSSASYDGTVIKSSSSFPQFRHNYVYLWLQNQPLLHLNYVDELFRKELSSSTSSSLYMDYLTSSSSASYISPSSSVAEVTTPCNIPNLFNTQQVTDSSSSFSSSLLLPHIDDVLFLSKHSAASGISSLTVHPIGIPWTTDTIRNGGVAGKCSPPSFRIAALYRLLLHYTKKHEQLKQQQMNNNNVNNISSATSSVEAAVPAVVSQEIQVTLEATHHGPYVTLPTCFVEIGSAASEWVRTDLSDI